MYDLPDGVKLATYDRGKLWDLWQVMKRYDSVFVDDHMRDMTTFLEQFIANDSIVMEIEGGMALFRKIRPGLRAEVHATFWDHKLSPRKELIEECLKWAFIEWDLHRIETYVAEYARAMRRFLEEKLHFQREGTMRSYTLHKGQLTDIHIYSILREEMFNG